MYLAPDSRSAAQLSSAFAAKGVSDVSISGPQVEDVFLRVAGEPELDIAKRQITTAEADFKLTPGDLVFFWAQVRVLFRKRL